GVVAERARSEELHLDLAAGFLADDLAEALDRKRLWMILVEADADFERALLYLARGRTGAKERCSGEHHGQNHSDDRFHVSSPPRQEMACVIHYASSSRNHFALRAFSSSAWNSLTSASPACAEYFAVTGFTFSRIRAISCGAISLICMPCLMRK